MSNEQKLMDAQAELQEVVKRYEQAEHRYARAQNSVFCKYFLDKVAKYFWTLLHVQIGQSCKAVASRA